VASKISELWRQTVGTEAAAAACMSHHRSLTFLFLSALVSTAACGDGDPASTPDAGIVAPTPVELRGQFDVQSRYTLAAPPAEVGGMLSALGDATDGSDDPSRYLVDLVISRLPEGEVKSLAQFLAPSIAAYVQAKLDMIAPRFAPGVRALAAGLAHLTTEFGTREELEIDAQGGVRRTLTALDVEGRVVDIARVTGTAHATLEDTTAGASPEHRVVVSEHALRLDYSQLLRLGFDRAVIPSVVPDAIDLGGALATLVDCEQLGAVLEAHLGLGSSALFAHACTLGLSVAAAEVDARMPRGITLTLSLHGAARGVDTDRDGQLDTLQTGAWDGAGARGTFVGSLR